MRLLELDPNLATRHARLSPKVNEETFWRHYFHRCALLRAEVGVGAALPPKSRGGTSGSAAAGASEDAEAGRSPLLPLVLLVLLALRLRAS